MSAALMPCRFVDEQEEPKEADNSADDNGVSLVAREGSQPSGKEPAKLEGKNAAPQKNRYLRVKEGLVDSFLTDVSNLFITCERLKDIQSRMSRDLRANSLVDELRQINLSFSGQTAALQTSVVALRKVPARDLFSKFPRVARTLATELGKQLDVHLEGEEIEIDKSLVEDLDGPLMHMIRNVCDHAIDLPQKRLDRGVEETGNLWLNCELSKTHVVITIKDDGRGIDPGRLRTKVVDKEILSQEQAAALSDQQAIELVFHPGFSTAEKISDVSGRGVGLDVVRTTLREHNGDVHVVSHLGVGTTFRLEIPIRTAVIVVDALLLKQEQNVFALPFEYIREIIEFQPEDFSSVQGNYVVTVRGKPYAAVPLSALLGMAPRTQAATKGPSWNKGLIVTGKKGQICLLVDDILSQRKLVFNEISDILDTTENIDGVSQLGGGQLAMVLNASELIESASTNVTEPMPCV
ncbi:MAG: ATP-binding protein [Pirellulales bacterium]